MSKLSTMMAFAVACLMVSGTAGQVLEDLPDVAQGIGVDQKLGERLPLLLEFDDDENNHVALADYFNNGKPVLLSFNYSNCPQLCVVQLNNLAAALTQIDLVPGKDFEIVSVSIDPLEQPQRLRETKRKYVVAYGNLDSAGGWHFLRTSDRKTISTLASSCGFRYKYVPEQKIYSHPSAFIFCSPDGRIARYLDGLDGRLENSLKPALLEAGQGKIGSLTDKVLYFAGCYVYDSSTGQYSGFAMRLMRLGGIVTVIALLIGLVPYWIRRPSRSPAEDPDTQLI